MFHGPGPAAGGSLLHHGMETTHFALRGSVRRTRRCRRRGRALAKAFGFAPAWQISLCIHVHHLYRLPWRSSRCWWILNFAFSSFGSQSQAMSEGKTCLANFQHFPTADYYYFFNIKMFFIIPLLNCAGMYYVHVHVLSKSKSDVPFIRKTGSVAFQST